MMTTANMPSCKVRHRNIGAADDVLVEKEIKGEIKGEIKRIRLD